MIRMQIQVSEQQAAALRRRARMKNVSVAAVVRDAIDRELGGDDEQNAAWERALSVIGRFHGDAQNVAVEHDKYLDDAYLPRT
jgi:hypothetical protein